MPLRVEGARYARRLGLAGCYAEGDWNLGTAGAAGFGDFALPAAGCARQQLGRCSISDSSLSVEELLRPWKVGAHVCERAGVLEFGVRGWAQSHCLGFGGGVAV